MLRSGPRRACDVLDPLGLRLEAAFPKLAGSHPSDLLRDDKPRPLENLDVLLHAGQRHPELIRETGDRRVPSAKLIDDPAAGRIRERRKRSIEVGALIVNHVVQWLTYDFATCKLRLSMRQLPFQQRARHAKREMHLSRSARAGGIDPLCFCCDRGMGLDQPVECVVAVWGRTFFVQTSRAK